MLGKLPYTKLQAQCGGLESSGSDVDPKPRDIAREAVDGATWRYNATTVLVFAWEVLRTWSAGFHWT